MTQGLDADQQFDEAFRRASTDPLTGLYNRQYILDAIEKDTRRARRYGTPLACLMLDLDGFRKLNEDCGHLEGDTILRIAADTISATVREIDIAARYGADEFCILAPATGLDGAMLLAERLRDAIAAMDVVAGRRLMALTARVGVVCPTTMSQLRPATLIDCAESALRQAKLSGDSICAYTTPYVVV
jgi:diguanylate cyclase (GGDEF)-like protein